MQRRVFEYELEHDEVKKENKMVSQNCNIECLTLVKKLSENLRDQLISKHKLQNELQTEFKSYKYVSNNPLGIKKKPNFQI